MLSVIVPTCNRNALLSKCLDLLAPCVQTINSDLYEVIVTDDSKNNEAKNLIEEYYPWVKWIEGPKRGPAANRNNGANYSSGSWLVFIDDDCLPDSKLLEEYQKAIQCYPETQAFEGAILPDDWELLKEDMAECPVNTTGNCFWTANVCIDTALFKQINGFDERFLIAAQEDQDIYHTILSHSKVLFVSEAKVVHPVRKISLIRKIKQIPLATRNWFLFEKKHNKQNLSRIFSLLFKFVIDFLKGFLVNFCKGKFKSSLYQFSLLLFTIPLYLLLAFKNYNNERYL